MKQVFSNLTDVLAEREARVLGFFGREKLVGVLGEPL